ncbi:MAG: hypothetical protein HYR80_07870 [Nitrospirae bacterium]|nr:hypothetical protein [Nitrospirota bacterium]
MKCLKNKGFLSLILLIGLIYGCGGGGSSSSTGGGGGAGGGCNYTPLASNKFKISVKENGIYVITPAILKSFCIDSTGTSLSSFKLQNFDPSANPPKLIDIPVTFDLQGNIEFYGVGVNRNDYTALNADYTETNVYWLVPGLPVEMATKSFPPPPPGPPPTSSNVIAMTTLHMETNSVYWPDMVNGAGYDHWFWAPDVVKGQIYIAKSFDFNNNFYINNYDSSLGNQIGLTVYLQADNPDPLKLSPDSHDLTLSLNTFPLTPHALWSVSSAQTNTPFYYKTTFQQTLTLSPSPNILTISTSDLNVAGVYLNWFELEYPGMAYNDQITFHGNITSASTYTFTINGFTQNQVEIFDISDPLLPQPISATNISWSGYQVTLNDYVLLKNNYIALTPAQRKTPANITLANGVDLTQVAGPYDYVIITHENFLTNIQPLATYRGSGGGGGGHKVYIAKIGDVYDSYSGGISTPQAIKDFLKSAYSGWITQYVLLVGDASIDYKNYLGYGQENFVPTALIDYSFGQTVSDYWFVENPGCNTVSNCYPVMAIGRLPAKTGTEVDTMVNKIKSYETTPKPFPATWNKYIAFISGGDSSFDNDSDILAGLLPTDYTAVPVYYNYFQSLMNSTILSTINSGALVTNYMGHGSVGFWANCLGGACNNKFFETTTARNDVASLNNSTMLTFLVTLDCLNGMFAGSGEGKYNTLYGQDNPYSVAKTFLKSATGGSVASFSPTGQGYTTNHKKLATELYQTLFGTISPRVPVIGDAIKQAEKAVLQNLSPAASPQDLETFSIFVLLGDPATQLALP